MLARWRLLHRSICGGLPISQRLAALVHGSLLLFNLLDDEERRIEEPVHTVFQAGCLASTEFGSDRSSNTAVRSE